MKLRTVAGATFGLALAITIPWASHNRDVHGVPIVSGTFGNYAMAVDNAPPETDGLRLWHKARTVKDKVELSRTIFRAALLDYPMVTAKRGLIRLRIAMGPESSRRVTPGTLRRASLASTGLLC